MKDIHAFEPIWENWVIDEEIGRGSYGIVWKAHREDQFSHIRQYAAVKHISIPKEEGQGEDDIPFPSEEARSQYYRNMLNQLIVEIDAMISLRGKPNIVSYEEHKIVPKDQNSGYDLFLRMELLKSVPKYIKEIKRPLQRKEVIQLGIDIATALEILESRNFVHRDIKPDNIFIDDEKHFKLGDFGTARILEATGNASTKTGTPNYMAPEVYTKSVQYDQTVDIYSLGIMLYRYMNNGYLPFMSETEISPETALVRRIRGETMQPPCNADERLSAIILKACAYKAEDRYQNAKAIKKDLQKCLEEKFIVEIPIICQTDDGQEIYRGYKKAQTGSKVKITVDDTPYKRFLSEDKEIISAREITITIEDDGKLSPPEARFIWRDSSTLLGVSVKIICEDENNNEILIRKVECFYQNHNLVKAPSITGYKPIGQTEIEVEVLRNRTSRPPQVVFQYRKDTDGAQPSDVYELAECDIPVLCMLENGEEILNSKRTCREKSSNIVKAPEITGYVLLDKDTKKVSVNHNGDADPDKVIFTYKKIISEKQKASITVLCRDDYGNELKRDTAVCNAGQTLSLTAPEIKGFKLVNEDKKNVDVSVNDKGKPSQSEVLFVYEKEKRIPINKKRIAIIGIVAVLLLTFSGIGAWFLNRPVPQYNITWKNEDTVLEVDNNVASNSMPEYNGSMPTKSEDSQYTYTFKGWTPNIGPVKTNEVYSAVFERTEKSIAIEPTPDTSIELLPENDTVSENITGSLIKETALENELPSIADSVAEASDTETETVSADIADNSIEPPASSFKITWQIGTETETTLVESGEKPTPPTAEKAADQQYTYTFSKWEPEVKEVTGDATYTAVFSSKVNKYKITWQDDSGKTIATASTEYGTMPTSPTAEKAEDQQYTYTFSKWEPEVKEVTGDATYTAVFTPELNKYKITWQDDSGKTIATASAEYGTMPTPPTAEKASDQQYTYTFSKWAPEVKEVTGDATYTAVFTAGLK